MNDKRVAILMATYNGGRYIREQIESIKNQTFKNWTLFVSDDGSCDETLEVVNSFEDPRIVVVASRNSIGTASGNFMGLARYASSYDYAFFCDQDDVWFPDKIEAELAAIESIESTVSPSVPVLAFTDSVEVDEGLERIRSSFVKTLQFNASTATFAQVVIANVAQGCTVAINASVVSLLIEYGLNKEVGMHDWWALILAMCFGESIFIDRPTMMYRQHSGNAVGSTDTTFLSWLKRLIKKPSLLFGWMQRAKDDASSAVARAESIERQLGSRLNLEKKNALKEISLMPSLSFFGRVRIICKHKLVRCRDIHKAAYWFFGFVLL